MKDKEVVRPKCCGECRIYIRDPDNRGRGWCDNWGGVLLHDEDVCHPNLGIKKGEQHKVANGAQSKQGESVMV